MWLRSYLNLKLKLYSFDVAHINYIKRVWTCEKKITFKLQYNRNKLLT